MTVRELCIMPIRFYRKYISPRKRYPSCKYSPTCSQYAVEAIRTRGPFVGIALSVWRILRCNPFSRGGYDPVPEKGFARVRLQKELDESVKNDS